jgi:hypothetical protein
MKKYFANLFRIVLFVLYISYFLITLFVNIGQLELKLKPLDRLHITHVECIENGTICLGTYPEEHVIQKIRPKTVVTLLNPKFPFSKELARAEKRHLSTLGIEVITMPLPKVDPKSEAYQNLLALLQKSDLKRPVYIHAYLFDRRLKKLEHRLIMEYKTAKGTVGNRGSQ